MCRESKFSTAQTSPWDISYKGTVELASWCLAPSSKWSTEPTRILAMSLAFGGVCSLHVSVLPSTGCNRSYPGPCPACISQEGCSQLVPSILFCNNQSR